MKEKEIIKQFVLNKEIEDGRESSLIKALEDSRRLYKNKDLWEIIDALSNSNNPNTCEEKMIELTKRMETSFLSLIGYLILLDMIGKVFTKENHFISAIDAFGSPELKEHKYTVKALRNSLAHNYGLVNIPENPIYDENSLHKFTLFEGKNNDGKIFSKEKKWKRENWTDKNDNTSTIVYVQKLVDEIENLIQNLQEKARNEELSICLDGAIEELYARFTIKH